MFSQLISRLRRVYSVPIRDLGGAQRLLRNAIDLVRHGARELRQDRAPQMASALTYRTIFSLIPIAVLMLMVFRAFGGFEKAAPQVQERLYRYLGIDSIELSQPKEQIVEEPTDTSGDQPLGDVSAQQPDETVATAVDPEVIQPEGIDTELLAAQERVEANEQLQGNIAQTLNALIDRVSEVSVGSLGVIGLAVLIWAALALLIELEQCFNQIYVCPGGRPWHMRVPIYWAVITLGPVLLLVSFNLVDASVSHLAGWIGVAGDGAADGGGALVVWMGRLGSLTASCLLLFLLYVLMPNTRVRVKPALVGAVVAGVLWEVAKWVFRLYVSQAVSYSVLYGTLGLIPLFLLWLYFTWLIMLFGLEVSYTLQAMRGGKFEQESAEVVRRFAVDPIWLIPVLARIGRGFMKGQAVTADAISEELRIPRLTVVDLIGRLESEGLINRTQPRGRQAEGFVLATAPENIDMAGLLARWAPTSAHYPHGARDVPGIGYMRRLTTAVQDSATGTSLLTVLNGDEPSALTGGHPPPLHDSGIAPA